MKISKSFEKFLEAEIKKLDKELEILDKMTLSERMNCCSNHAEHEIEVAGQRNEAIKIWNKYIESLKGKDFQESLRGKALQESLMRKAFQDKDRVNY